jgi:hypothetical protein
MDSINNEEVEEILDNEEVIEETEETTEEVVEEDEVEELDSDEAIEEATSAEKLNASVASARKKADPAPSKVKPSKESPKYKGLYKSVGGGAVVPEPVATDSTASGEKQMKNVDAKRSGKTESVKVHMDAMFSGEELSEDFKTKASTIFETAINERVEAIETELKEEYESRLLEQVEGIKSDMTQQLDSYLSYVVEEWMTENKLSVEKGLRTEIAEEFMEGLRNLFLQHNIEVPQGKVDLVDEMAGKIEELTNDLNEQVNKSIELKEQVSSLERKTLVTKMTEGLADTDKDRFVKLAEGVGFDSNDEFKTKLQVIRESYFGGSGKVTLVESKIEDDMDAAENAPTDTEETLTESMEAYSNMLSRLSRAKAPAKTNSKN